MTYKTILWSERIISSEFVEYYRLLLTEVCLFEHIAPNQSNLICLRFNLPNSVQHWITMWFSKCQAEFNSRPALKSICFNTQQSGAGGLTQEVRPDQPLVALSDKQDMVDPVQRQKWQDKGGQDFYMDNFLSWSMWQFTC
jgi:hypothetical protein